MKVRALIVCMLMAVLATLGSACGSASGQSATDSVAMFDPGATSGPTSAPAAGSTSSGTAPTKPVGSGSKKASSPPRRTGPITATFIGDSVPAAIDYVPAAQRAIKRGLHMRLDLEVCRRLVMESCTYDGNTPATALQQVHRYGSSLGRVLVVDVGYNDYSGTYRDDMARIVHAADADGVSGIVWVTMREARSSYDWTNHVIKTEARRFPNVVVADWNKVSTGKPWFGSDGLHLNDAGAMNLATFLRPYIYQAAQKSPA